MTKRTLDRTRLRVEDGVPADGGFGPAEPNVEAGDKVLESRADSRARGMSNVSGHARRVFGEVSWSAGASAAVALQGLIVVPLMTRALPKEQYGTWALFTTALSFLCLLILLGSDSAMARFLPEARAPGDRVGVVLTLGLPPLLLAMLASVVVVLSAPILSVIIPAPVEIYLLLAIGLPIEVAMWLSFGYFRGAHRFRAFAVIRICAALLFVLLATLVALVLPSLTLFVVSYLAAELIAFVALVHSLRGSPLARGFSFQRLRSYLPFMLPLVPNAILFWLMESSDRYVIGTFRGLAEVAEYSLAYTLGAIILTLWSPVGLLILPRAAALWDRRRLDRLSLLFELLVRCAIVLGVAAVIGLAFLARDIVPLLSSATYLNAAPIVGIVAAAYLCYVLLNAYNYLVLIGDRGLLITVVMGAAAILNLALNIVFVPRFGILAAALSTAASYLILAGAARVIAGGVVPLRAEWGIFVRVVPAASALAAFLWWLPLEGIGRLVVGIPVGGAIYLALAGVFRALTPHQVHDLAHVIGEAAEAPAGPRASA